MAHGHSFEAYSERTKQLIRLMQDLNFGRIMDLPVRNGEPVFDQPVQVVRTVKIAASNGPRPEVQCGDFDLKVEVQSLLHWIARIKTGCIQCIEVKHGLPFVIEIKETFQA